MLISYRGHMGEKDPWQTQGGMATEPILRALNIPTWHLTNSTDIYRRLKDAQTLANASLRSAALLYGRCASTFFGSDRVLVLVTDLAFTSFIALYESR